VDPTVDPQNPEPNLHHSPQTPDSRPSPPPQADLSLSDRGLATRDGKVEFSCATERAIFEQLDRLFRASPRVEGGCEYKAPNERECNGKMGKGQSGRQIGAGPGGGVVGGGGGVTAEEGEGGEGGEDEDARKEFSAEERPDTCDY